MTAGRPAACQHCHRDDPTAGARDRRPPDSLGPAGTIETARCRPSIPSAPRPPPAGRFLDAIRAALPDLRLLTDAIDREAYRNDETAYLKAGLPLAVALPTATAEVATLVRLAAEHRVPSCRAARGPACPAAPPASRAG